MYIYTRIIYKQKYVFKKEDRKGRKIEINAILYEAKTYAGH